MDSTLHAGFLSTVTPNMMIRLLVCFTLWVGLLPAAVRADGDAGKGEDLFRACSACHEIGVGARNRTGPVLNNIVGRRAASRSGYAYSRGMKEAAAEEGLVWTPEALDGYIENPRAYVRGTRMAYAGLHDPQTRADLIAFLATLDFDKPSESKVLK